MEIVKQTLSVTRVKEFYKEREEGELDLVKSIHHFLKLKKGEYIAKLFIKDIDILTVLKSKPDVQKIILNKYFTNLLLRYRSCGGFCSTEVLHCLTLDVPPLEWLSIVTQEVLGFIDVCNVYEKVYNLN